MGIINKLAVAGRCGLLLLGSFGLWACDGLPVPVEFPSATVEVSSLPPCVDDDCNCRDFRDQALAQAVFDAFPDDPFVLDRDGNGVPCESLPAVSPGLDPTVPPSQNPHLLLGNPSNATADNPNNLLIERPQYALSYNRDRGIANWASWQLSADWLGSVERQDDFRQDGGLPAGVYQVTPNDYQGSGFDRGHIVPSGDRTRSEQDNSATFLMTNIQPQSPQNNRGLWRELEEYTRDLVYQLDYRLVVIAGGYGELDDLANGRITIPSRLWKIVAVLDHSNPGEVRLDSAYPILAIDVPNQDTPSTDWQTYRTTVDRIELATGYDFFAQLPVPLQEELESSLGRPIAP